jgi:hydroxyacylglutathione hydrolase
MLPTRIVRAPILPLGMVNAHVIISEARCILVDAGLPNTEVKIERTLARRGMTLKDVKLIVVTHAHVDHAGGAARLRELSGAPILALRPVCGAQENSEVRARPEVVGLSSNWRF